MFDTPHTVCFVRACVLIDCGKPSSPTILTLWCCAVLPFSQLCVLLAAKPCRAAATQLLKAPDLYAKLAAVVPVTLTVCVCVCEH